MKKLGINPESMGIDTWAVDFVLLDQQGQVLGKTAGYRDRRTVGIGFKSILNDISREELYRGPVIQKQIFNTIYQHDGCEGKAAGSPFTGRKLPHGTGLLKLPADRGEEAGVHQCHHNPAGKFL